MAATEVAQQLVHGSIASGLESVIAEFEKNFRERGDVGASCAAYYRGEKVVDLWGGERNRKAGTPWNADSMVVVFSTTKGMAAMTLALAHSRGLLDYEEKVATYWPEFSQQEKSSITVRQLLAHQAGLCVVDEPLTDETLADLDHLAEILARQKPVWEPGTKHGYHAFTIGWYEGELIRRIDPQHRSLGHFFQDEIAKPLGLEFYIGLPSAIPDTRLATMHGFGLIEIVGMVVNPKAVPRFLRDSRNPKTLTARAFGNPKGVWTDLKVINDRGFLALENPAISGVGEARALARAYSEFATGGRALALSADTLSRLTAPPVMPTLGPYDEVLEVEAAYSLGYDRPSAAYGFGSSAQCFGTPGAGGTFAFADPVAHVGWAYTTDKMEAWCPPIADDRREKALRDAFYRCL